MKKLLQLFLKVHLTLTLAIVMVASGLNYEFTDWRLYLLGSCGIMSGFAFITYLSDFNQKLADKGIFNTPNIVLSLSTLLYTAFACYAGGCLSFVAGVGALVAAVGFSWISYQVVRRNLLANVF